ncbi:hypothetical protein AB6A40_005019 [Gnathostoma spinigerum]|uniref:DNA polymerase delta subunit 3 n=1 Tax=Gnathostoma spinigerum TaxID=75299 RepID=A0ABD6EFD0_9BILA
MGLDVDELLVSRLFDSGKPVTAVHLSRHANISFINAAEAINVFYERNKDKGSLHAVYLLMGLRKKAFNGERSGGFHEPKDIWHMQIVRDCDLDKAKSRYSRLDTCEVFALHKSDIEDLCILHNIDRLDDRDFVDSDYKRSWITCPEASEKREEMLQKHAGDSERFEEMAKKNDEITMKEEPTRLRSVVKESAKRNDISDLFAKAVARKKHRSQSPKRSPRGSPFSTPKKKGTPGGSGSTQKDRGRRIKIDNEEIGKEHDEAGSVKENSKETYLNQKPIKRQVGSIEGETEASVISSQDDIFSAGDSSPERMEDDSVSRSCERTPTPPNKLRRSPRKLVAVEHVNDSSENGRPDDSHLKAKRKEYVTETFLDDDGFMVTKRVMKEVDVNEEIRNETSAANSQLVSSNVISGTVVSNSKSGTKDKKTAHGQSKINNFFKKL